MGSEAFDRLMERLDSEDRERIHEMAISYGLTFDDPSWVPFAITQMTLFEMEDLSADTVKEIEKATDRALNSIGNKAQEVSREARKVIEEQTRAIEQLRATMREMEKASAIEYQKALVQLADRQVDGLVATAAQGIVQDVVDKLTGKKSILTLSAATYIKALEQSQQRFTAAIDAAAAKSDAAVRQSAVVTSRMLHRAVYLATGCIAVYAIVLVGSVLL
ncbi:hypothetical protein [Paraburkholderia heleia]|uniref:hypothetical protein n=1 Tax=Paraburkholderia heleia TaxID=634127 RepID=UPI0031DDC8E4